MKSIVDENIPLLGHIAFGIVDRGTNLIEIRPTSSCNLKCIFCSTAANSKIHPVDYEVKLPHLITWIKYIVKLKGSNLEAHIDSVGEPLTYPKITALIKEIKKIKNFSTISIQTNGTLLDKNKVKALEKAGLNRINLSLHTLDQELAKKLAGCSYNIKKIIDLATLISQSNIKLLFSPVLLPSINEEDIQEIIKLVKKLNAEIAIQKYEEYPYSRKIKVKKQSWWQFYQQLKKWEKTYNIKLIYKEKTYERRKIPYIFKKGERILVKIVLPGWFNYQMISKAKNRLISINNCKAKINDEIHVKITQNKNSIYIAEPL